MEDVRLVSTQEEEVGGRHFFDPTNIGWPMAIAIMMFMLLTGLGLLGWSIHSLWGREALGFALIGIAVVLVVFLVWLGIKETYRTSADFALKVHRQTIEGGVHQEQNDSLRNVMMMMMLTRGNTGIEPEALVKLASAAIGSNRTGSHDAVMMAREIIDASRKFASEQPDAKASLMNSLFGGEAVDAVVQEVE